MKDLEKLYSSSVYQDYLRVNPEWYLILNHDPQKIQVFKHYYRLESHETFADKLDRVCMILEMVKMMI